MFALAFHSEWLPLLRLPGASADFPAKSKYDINGVSSGDALMMWEFLDDDTYITTVSGLWGIKG